MAWSNPSPLWAIPRKRVFILMQIRLIFTRKVLHVASSWKHWTERSRKAAFESSPGSYKDVVGVLLTWRALWQPTWRTKTEDSLCHLNSSFRSKQPTLPKIHFMFQWKQYWNWNKVSHMHHNTVTCCFDSFLVLQMVQSRTTSNKKVKMTIATQT